MFQQLLHSLTWAQVALLLGTYIIPQISQLLTKKPNGWTSTWTVVLAAASTFIGESTRANFDFKGALGVLVGAIVVAFLGRWHIGGTGWEKALIRNGNKGVANRQEP